MLALLFAIVSFEVALHKAEKSDNHTAIPQPTRKQVNLLVWLIALRITEILELLAQFVNFLFCGKLIGRCGKQEKPCKEPPCPWHRSNSKKENKKSALAFVPKSPKAKGLDLK